MSSVVTGISHSLEKSSETHLPSTFLDIPRISHIPKNRKTLCTGNYMGYPRDIPYPKKKLISMDQKFFGIYPGISHVPKN